MKLRGLNRRQALLACALLLPVLPAAACLWDRDTLRDELKLRAVDFDLITGQIPHHGEVYYQRRVTELSGGELTKDSRNDLAVALIRLKRFDEAEKLLKVNLADQPGDYFTLSNLGVLEKKRGNYRAAANLIEQALKIRPEGHLGLGDWYLQMLEYRATRSENQELKPGANFLGVDYKIGAHRLGWTGDGVKKLSAEEKAHYEKLRRLLENDQTFADGFVAMGDFQCRCGNLHLAFISYTRALSLEHGNESEIRRRRRAILEEWQSASSKPIGNRLAYWRREIAKAEAHLPRAAGWLKQFQSMEASIVKSSGTFPTYSVTEDKLTEKGIRRPAPR